MFWNLFYPYVLEKHGEITLQAVIWPAGHQDGVILKNARHVAPNVLVKNANFAPLQVLKTHYNFVLLFWRVFFDIKERIEQIFNKVPFQGSFENTVKLKITCVTRMDSET